MAEVMVLATVSFFTFAPDWRTAQRVVAAMRGCGLDVLEVSKRETAEIEAAVKAAAERAEVTRKEDERESAKERKGAVEQILALARQLDAASGRVSEPSDLRLRNDARALLLGAGLPVDLERGRDAPLPELARHDPVAGELFACWQGAQNMVLGVLTDYGLAPDDELTVEADRVECLSYKYLLLRVQTIAGLTP
jgi:hypothetical protein